MHPDTQHTSLKSKTKDSQGCQLSVESLIATYDFALNEGKVNVLILLKQLLLPIRISRIIHFVTVQSAAIK